MSKTKLLSKTESSLRSYFCDGSFQAHVHDESELVVTRLREALLLCNCLPCLLLDVLGVCYHPYKPTPSAGNLSH